MIRFDSIERLGIAVAAFSDKSDGDCRRGSAGHERFCAACGVEPALAVAVGQVHGTRIIPFLARARNPNRTGSPSASITSTSTNEHVEAEHCDYDYEHGKGTADGIATDVPGRALTVFVADCAPIYLVDPRQRVAGLLHAGWRGTFGGISREGVLTLQREWQCRPGDLHAVIGPCAGPCCYEVSVELAEQWREAGYAAVRRHLHLGETNARQLSEAGVPRDQIVVTRLCTICDGRFFSHRAQPDGARNAALLAL